MTVGEWWERLGMAGWSAPSLPAESYGRGVARNDAVRVAETIAAHGALAAPGGLGLLLAAPTIATHGTREQIDHYVADIVTGRKAWCQLFSEPVAGSDLAGLQTRAVRDGDEWVVTGQKVWTSSGHVADLGMLLARTDSDVPKHQGISYFAIDMHQPGIEVRPLREMTGRAMFNEVFLPTREWPTMRSSVSATAGGRSPTRRWRSSVPGSARAPGTPPPARRSPGTVAGHLTMRAGEFVSSKRGVGGGAQFRGAGRMLIDLAKATGAIDDPTVRQDLMRLHTIQEIGRMNTLRLKAEKARGGDVPGFGNIGKLSMSAMVRLQRDIGLRILGADGMLHSYDGRPANPLHAIVTEMALFAQGPPIYGGTDQIQRNIIGERVLGLPKEPGNERTVPFSQLPKNA